MSRRTTPVFREATPWNTLSSSPSLPTSPLSVASPAQCKPPSDASRMHTRNALFEALDFARFDQVRRAVTQDATCLQARKAPPPTITTNTSEAVVSLSPIDYALHNCRTWTALIEHCQRTGIAIPYAGDLTFRERLKAMNTIMSWLLSHPMVVPPSGTPLHAAISNNFYTVSAKLIQMNPQLATSKDSRGKTPLHVCCLSSRMPAADAAKYVRLLAAAGADINARDLEGRTAMHDLVTFLALTAPTCGLIQRRKRTPSLASVAVVIDELLIHGASLYVTDLRSASPLDMALATGCDYLVFAQRAAALNAKICQTPFAKRCTGDAYKGLSASGLWGELPDDVIMRIFRYLSPKEAVSGIGSSCKALRRFAVSGHLWKQFEISFCLAVVRNSVIDQGIHLPTSRVNPQRLV